MKLKTEKAMTNSTTIAQKRTTSLPTAKQTLAAIGVGVAAISALLAAAVWGSPLGFFTAVGGGMLIADALRAKS